VSANTRGTLPSVAATRAKSKRTKTKTVRGPTVQLRAALTDVLLGDTTKGLAKLRRLGATWWTEDEARHAAQLFHFLFFRAPFVRDGGLAGIEDARAKLRRAAAIVSDIDTLTKTHARIHFEAEMLWRVRAEPSDTLTQVAGSILCSLGKLDPRFLSVDHALAAGAATKAGSPAALAAKLAKLGGVVNERGTPLTAASFRDAVRRAPTMLQLSDPTTRSKNKSHRN
jgi:hypothetical protein